MNPKIPIWVYASLCKFFSLEAQSLGFPFFSEGVDDETSEVYQTTNLSLRVDGPAVIESSGGAQYRFEVQALLTQIGRRENGYFLYQKAGEVAKSMRGVIPMYKIPDSPGEKWSCLEPDPRTVESVRIVNLGMSSTSSKIRQIAVVGKYFLDYGTL